MGALGIAKMYGRFVLGLPGYLRRRVTLDEAKAAVREGLAERETNFLRIVRLGIFGNPRSPYLPLLRLAGCELGDIEASVHEKGLDATLEWLRGEGVYFTFEEYKGRQPVVRNGQEISLEEYAFDNPLTSKKVEGETSGSTGTGTRVETDLDNLFSQVPHLMLARHVHGLIGFPVAVWYGAFPDPTGVGIFLRAAPYGGTPERWFTPATPGQSRPGLKYRLATEYVLLMSRLCGVPCPRPEPLPFDDAIVIARWAAEAVQAHGTCQAIMTSSLATRVCDAARKEGLDLTGTVFFGGGEPLTAAKSAALARVGARYAAIYIGEDTGPVGIACTNPVEDNDQHLLEDYVALIQHPREVPGSGVEVDAFYFTSLHITASKILLNVESDDYGIVEDRSCGCPLEELGYRRHVRQIRSFGKLTGEGVTLVGSEMVRILEEVLPERFGGGPHDFQLLEEEGESGRTRLTLLVDPDLDVPRDEDVVEAMLEALADSSVAADIAGGIWQQADTFRVRRQQPEWTPRGKFFPLRIAALSGRTERAPGGATTDPEAEPAPGDNKNDSESGSAGEGKGS